MTRRRVALHRVVGPSDPATLDPDTAVDILTGGKEQPPPVRIEAVLNQVAYELREETAQRVNAHWDAVAEREAARGQQLGLFVELGGVA
ncbi:MAG: hypothetical protein AAF467_27310 [Actinomycetota bacterium]